MSVYPLSAAQREGIAPDPDREVAAYESPPGSTDDAKLDSVIESAMSKIPSATDDADSPRKRDLDGVISEGLEKVEKAEAERQSFAESRASRDELQSYYGEQGDLRQTLQAYLAFAEEFKRYPQQAGLRFAESFMRVTPYGLKPRPQQEKVEPYIDPTGKRYSGKVLNSLLDDAIERSTDERKTFEATALEREQLKALFPGKSFAEAMQTLAKINRDAIVDPIATAATLAGGFGMPVTERQQREHADHQHAAAVVDRASQQLPGLEELAPAITSILADPRFQRTGNREQDLHNAYSIAAQQYQQAAAHDAWAVAQLNAIAKTSPTLAHAVVDTLSKDRAFAQHAANMDPVSRFHAATSWAKAKSASNQRDLAKAQRVKPVKSSSGAIPNNAGSRGVDAAIARAMRDF